MTKGFTTGGALFGADKIRAEPVTLCFTMRIDTLNSRARHKGHKAFPPAAVRSQGRREHPETAKIHGPNEHYECEAKEIGSQRKRAPSGGKLWKRSEGASRAGAGMKGEGDTKGLCWQIRSEESSERKRPLGP
jgi:hypothetical protein